MKATNKMLFTLSMVAVVGAIIFFGCKKDGSSSSVVPPGKQQVNLFLTDGPGFFDKINVDIKSVKVLIDTCSKSNEHHDRDDDDDTARNHCIVWDSLAIKPGVYNLLTLSNGTDTLLGNGVIPKGRIIRIKISLGPNNSLVKDSVTYPLSLPADMHATIILKLRGGEFDEFEPGRFRIWMDFDGLHSIIRMRDNEFVLRPVIHLFIIRLSGTVAGVVTPRAAFPVISIYNNTDTAYALPNGDGGFKVRGLDNGTYTVFINGSNGYNDTTINNVSVTVGKTTNLGTIKLHK